MTVAKPRAVPWRTIVGVCFVVAATVHAYQFAVESRHAWGLGGLSPYALVQLLFVLSFLACAIGFFVRAMWGDVTSILALVTVLFGYLYWYLHSATWLAAVRENDFYREYPQFAPSFLLGLVKARWWDIAILIFVVILLVWQFKVLTKGRRVRVD